MPLSCASAAAAKTQTPTNLVPLSLLLFCVSCVSCVVSCVVCCVVCCVVSCVCRVCGADMYAAEYYDEEEEEEVEEYAEEELTSAPLPTQKQTRLRAEEALVMSPSPDQGLIGKLTTWIRPINYTYT